MSSAASILTVKGLQKAYGDTPALVLPDLSIVTGSRTAIIGETGSGKTTLLKLIAGLEQPDAGVIYLDGKPIPRPSETLIPGHPAIGFLSQYFELRNNYRVAEWLEMAPNWDPAYAQPVYALCRIAHLLRRKTDQVSGGERQRIALARLLLARPRILLLDEPFSNLDPAHTILLKTVLAEIQQAEGITCLLSSHMPADSLAWAGRLLVLRKGQIIQDGEPETIYYKPAHAYTASLLGPYQLIRSDQLATLFLSTPLSRIGQEQALFIRPQQWHITAAKRVTGFLVQSVRFLGTHYELEVEGPGILLTAYTSHPGFTAGDAVSVSIAPGADWLVDPVTFLQ